jgi:hypothetical protein
MVARPFSLIASSNSNRSKTVVDTKRTLQHRDMPTSSRNLYTESALGISKLDRLRDQKNQLFTGASRDRYIQRLSDYLKADDVESIYKDDLVNLIGIAKTEQDLDLIEELVVKSGSKASPFFQGWGALLMRLYYKMNQLDRAYRNVKDVEKFGDFFNLRSCYKILMTMLYEAKRYDAVLDVFHFSQERLRNLEHQETNEEESGVERDLSSLAFAALAKMNNPDALKKAEELYRKLTANSKTIGLRPSSFFAYIACSNDQPKLALNLISNTPNRNYISLRELKIVSLIKLGRYEDILLQLREYVSNIKRESNLLLKSTYDIIQQNKAMIQDEVVRQELNDLLLEIKENGHVSDTTIEELLFKPIDMVRPPVRVNTNAGYNKSGRYMDRNRDSNYYNNRYQADQRNDNRYQSRQPRNQYGYNQYNNQQRPRRRFNDEEGDAYDDSSNSLGEKGDDRRGQKRFTYQNMNFD